MNIERVKREEKRLNSTKVRISINLFTFTLFLSGRPIYKTKYPRVRSNFLWILVLTLFGRKFSEMLESSTGHCSESDFTTLTSKMKKEHANVLKLCLRSWASQLKATIWKTLNYSPTFINHIKLRVRNYSKEMKVLKISLLLKWSNISTRVPAENLWVTLWPLDYSILYSATFWNNTLSSSTQLIRIK